MREGSLPDSNLRFGYRLRRIPQIQIEDWLNQATSCFVTITDIMAEHNDSTKKVSLARLVARRLHEIASNPLPPTLISKVSAVSIDRMGAISSSTNLPWWSSLVEYARNRPGPAEAFVWGLREQRSAEIAAFVNAAFAHSAVRDDMHIKSCSHIGAIAISTAFALAERDSWSGEALVKGIIGGYEAAVALGTAVQQSSGFNRRLRPSGIIGAFASAAVAVTASNVDEDTAVNALGFAANMGSGTNQWAWSGGLEIYIEMGTAAMNGIVAYDLAKAGMKCSEDVIEGKAGVLAANGAGGEGEAIFRKWLATAEIGRGIMEVKFKPVAGCNFAQTPVAVALKVAQEKRPSKIQNIVIRTTSAAKAYPGCDNPGPFNAVTQTKMSIQYGVGMVLTYGSKSEELFTKFDDQGINDLASKCTIQAVPEFDKRFQEDLQPAGIKITLMDGTVIEDELKDVPWLEIEAVIARFYQEISPVMSEELATKMIELSGEIHTIDDMAEFLKAAL